MIELDNITIRSGAFALAGISFTVPTGQYAVLMGRTGSGKTTLLEVVCGLRRPDAGRVRLMGHDVTLARPAERGVGYVPQDGALFPTLSVRDHLAFAPTVQRWPARRIQDRVAELADLLGLAHLLERTPHGLSGGERQRVALGRALAFAPPVLLLDEPLSALDEETRAGMYELLMRIRGQFAFTALHVTHSPAEAERLADCILRLEPDGVQGRPVVRAAPLVEALRGART
jgi:ABC-type sugar transport system ATPase subunit